MVNKFAHVKGDTIPAHECAWPGCKVMCPKSHAMCEPHWMMLPKNLQRRIWDTYVVGQEEDPNLASLDYVDALSLAIKWAHDYEAMFSAQRPVP
jgi:hypothetical protein